MPERLLFTLVALLALVALTESTACAPRVLAPATMSRTPASPASPATSTGVEVAVTVDDLPIAGPSFAGIDRVAIAQRMVEAFRRHHLPPVYGFVNGKRVDEAPQDPSREAVLHAWLAGGNALGNHTYSHVSLNDSELSTYFDDLEAGERILSSMYPSGVPWKVFRFPFLYEGDTLEKRAAVRRYLKTHGYTIAEVSIEADDWAYNAPFARCTDQHDAATLAALHTQFVHDHVEELRTVRTLTQKLMGRDIKHVLLLHIGAQDAEAMDDLLTAYEHEGVSWIDLPTALADPFYAIEPDKAYRFGASYPYVLAKARGVTGAKPAFSRDVEERLEKTCR